MAGSSKKEKKQSKRKRDSLEAEPADDEHDPPADEAPVAATKKDKKDKKAKKEKKEKKAKKSTPSTEDAADDSDAEESPSKKQKQSDDSDQTKLSKHALKRLERQKLMEQVPKVDEHGIAYTKLQLRRMRKRVEKGLHPVETPQEEHERLRREAELKREEEMELAGLMVISKRDEDDEEDDNEEGADGNSEDDDDEQGGHANDDASSADGNEPQQPKEHAPRPKKKPRSKPLPSDYTCMACQNKHKPAHWIYDCTSKVRMPGTNQVAKNLKGIHNPDCKVFVSGLPFDTKQKDVLAMFEGCGKIVHCKLVQFEDTKRCKGNAYITFGSKDDTFKALKLNGMKQKLKDGKELSLKVTKALSRALTKKGSSSPAKQKSQAEGDVAAAKDDNS